MTVTDFVNQYGVDRQHTNSLKWDALDERFGNPDLTPLWVADMEFKEPTSITDAIINRVHHGVFGYSIPDEDYFTAFSEWQKRRHNVNLKRDWLTFDNGVVNSLYTIVNTFTEPDDAVLVLTPVYYPFLNAVKDNHRQLVTSELLCENNHFSINIAEVEQKIIDNDVKLFIQCSPHNPVGRIWSEDELAKILEICHRHHVLVVSDEIHQDFEIGGQHFISALSVAGGKYTDNLIVVNAPSKTFNMATLLNSHVIIPNTDIQQRFLDGRTRFSQVELSVLGQAAGKAAYLTGEEWFDGLLDVIRHNYNIVKNEVAKRAPQIKVSELEGTYLLWLDLRAVVDPEKIHQFVQDQVGLAVDYGEWFGDQDKGFIRFNLATKPAYIQTAITTLIDCLDD